MTDRSIIFFAPMVRALLAGTKTQTRRVLKLRDHRAFSEFGPSDTKGYDWHFRDAEKRWHDHRNASLATLLLYAPGDRLYVRETAHIPRPGVPHLMYRADHIHALVAIPWRSSIHMPRWASRLTLTVTDVRVHRLQEISEADAIAEGCLMDPEPDEYGGRMPAEIAHERGGDVGWDCARDWYADLWDSLHGPEAWDANPWVVAVSFTVAQHNIDQVAA